MSDRAGWRQGRQPPIASAIFRFMRSTFVIFTLCLSVVACGQPANQPAAPADSAPPASAPQTAPAGPALIEAWAHFIILSGPRRERRRRGSTRACRWSSPSTTKRPCARSSEPRSSTRRRRCRIGVSPGRSGPTTTSMSTIPARSRPSRRSRRRRRSPRRAPRPSAPTSPRSPCAIRPIPKADRTKLARALRRRDARARARYPDDLDAATLYAESLMNLRPWKLWTLDGKPAKDTEEIVRMLESVLRARPGSPRREPLLHPHRRGLAQSRAALPSARRLEPLRRPPAIWCTCRRTSTPAPAITRRRRKPTSPERRPIGPT